MNSLAYRMAVIVGARRPRVPLVSSRALESRQLLAGMPNQGSGFVRTRTRQRFERLGPVKCHKIGIGPSTCRPIVAARSRRTSVSHHTALVSTVHVAAYEVAS